jgi:hypothetical protein
MTVEQLLAKLNTEYDKLEAELPAHYLAYGKYRYWYPGDADEYQSDRREIQNKLARQEEIRAIQYKIRQEEGRIVSE